MEEKQNYTEGVARAAFARLPDGVYEAADQVDQDVYTGEPVTVRLKLTIAGDHAIFDLTDSDGAAQSGINCTLPATTSAVFIGLASILPPMPMNAGVMRAIEIRARRGSIVWAQPPAAVSGLAITRMDCVIGVVVLALGQALPERAIGLPSAIVNSTLAGYDARPEFGAPFINYLWAFGGMGAAQRHNGANNLAGPFAASSTNIPCELQERRYPVLYRRYMLLADSGGDGATRGGLALDQLIEAYQPGSLSHICNRERFGPPGIFGGGPGRTSHLVVNWGTEQERNLGTFATNVPIGPGDVLSVWSNGGGGYGDPLERPVEAVVEDIQDGYASPEAAREQYGVVVRKIDRQRRVFEVDRDATERQRRAIRSERLQSLAN